MRAITSESSRCRYLKWFLRRHDNAIAIRDQPIAWSNPVAVQTHRDIALAFVALDGRHRHRRQREDADIERAQFLEIAHAAIDQQTGPTILRRCTGKVAARQRAA